MPRGAGGASRPLSPSGTGVGSHPSSDRPPSTPFLRLGGLRTRSSPSSPCLGWGLPLFWGPFSGESHRGVGEGPSRKSDVGADQGVLLTPKVRKRRFRDLRCRGETVDERHPRLISLNWKGRSQRGIHFTLLFSETEIRNDVPNSLATHQTSVGGRRSGDVGRGTSVGGRRSPRSHRGPFPVRDTSAKGRCERLGAALSQRGGFEENPFTKDPSTYSGSQVAPDARFTMRTLPTTCTC